MNQWIKYFGKFLPEIFHPEEDGSGISSPHYSNNFNKKELEIWDYLYINISFYMHFSIYSWFFLDSFRNIPNFSLYVFSISALTGILYFLYKAKYSRFLSQIILAYNFIVLATYNRLTYLSYFHGTNNIDLTVASLSITSVIIMLQAFRLKKMSAIYVGSINLLLYFATITAFAHIDNLIISKEAMLIPIFFFVFSTIITTFLIVSSNKVVHKYNQLSFYKQVIDHDLGLAKKVQDSLFPETNQIKGLQYAIFRKSQQMVGGDFFDFIQLREGNVGVFMTDVAGHGVSSAMVAAILKVLVSNMPYRLKLNPSGLLDYLDAKLYKDFGTHHASAIYMYFDFIGKQITIGNAGHPYPIYSDNGSEFVEITTEGAILGYKIKSPISISVSFKLEKGNRFFLFTDGLIETKNLYGNLLDIQDLLAILNKYRPEPDFLKFQNAIKAEIDSFFKGVDFSDDTMYLVLQVE